MAAIKSFQELLRESQDGYFMVELNELIEIHVSYNTTEITVLEYKTKNQLTPIKTTKYSSLTGSNFGKPSVEEKFNELIQMV
jgi:hypothetical protein